MLLAPGTRLGPYEILAPIGAGGMGEVYKARDTRLDRMVAIKVSQERFSERFEREARAVASLNHRHICQLYDVGPAYLVMEYVEGSPLKGPYPLARVMDYAAQILDALDAAHRKGIIHRDLKPANILLTPQGIKLLDFGLAKRASPLGESDDTQTALTGEGQTLGTLPYIAPEQLQGKSVDARADLFAFGCVFHEMLTGKLAFQAPSAAGVMARILEREPEPLDVPPAVARVVRACLAKDPEQRFQNALDLKRDLVWAMEQPATPTVSRPWWIAACAALILGALGGWAVSQIRPASSAADRVLRLEINPPEGAQLSQSVNTSGFALSPDGKFVAYVINEKGKNGLWVRPLDGPLARLLPGTQDPGQPFWSPDSRSIAFFSRAKLRRVELAGGEPQEVCDVAQGVGGSWDATGRIVYAEWNSGLFQVAASGGKPVSLTTLDTSRGEAFHYWPQILPGGRFLYFVRSDNPENSGVFAASFARPHDRVQLLTIDANALYVPRTGAGTEGKQGYLLWLRGGTLVAQEFDCAALKLSGDPQPIADPVARLGLHGEMEVAVSAAGMLVYTSSNGLTELRWRDRVGRPWERLGDPGEIGQYRLSPDGRRLALSTAGATGADVWLMDTDRGVPIRFSSKPGINIVPIWSPDGQSVVFSSGPPFNLFRKAASGATPEERLTQSPNSQFAQDWSRDGKFIVYCELIMPANHWAIWLLATTPGDHTRRNYSPSSFNLEMPRISPDSRWIAYQSDESGRKEVYIDTFPEPRGKVRVSTSGGIYPQWTADGREMFYTSQDSVLMSVSLKTGPGSIEPGTPHPLFPVRRLEAGSPTAEAARDGQRFLVSDAPENVVHPLRLIVNWQSLLKNAR